MRIVNMLKISGTTFIMMLAAVHSEPPINSYLSPNDGRTNLSIQIGAPDFNNGDGVNRNGGTSFGKLGNNGAGNNSSKLYDVPIGGNVGGNGLGQFPGNGFEDGQPSSSYGVFNGGFGENRGNGGRPSTSYGVSNANENNEGGFGNRGNERRPSTSYDVFENGNHRNGDKGKPSSSYGVLGANGNMNGKSRFNGGSSGGPSGSYGSPNESFGRELSTSYGSPNRNGNDNNGYSSGSSNGGSFINDGANGYLSGGPNGNTGNFGHGNGNFERREEERGRDNNRSYNDNAQEKSIESAKYEFSYKVKDQQTGSDYSHMETRNGDRAQGEFNVLLPDGRKQIVEYEADQDGFKPQIRYEGEANADGEYGSKEPNDNNNGYSSVRPAGQSFNQNNDNNLSGDIGYFSNHLGNNIGGDNANLGNNRQNSDNSGYLY